MTETMHVTEALVNRIRNRAAVGLAKYGTTLDRTDLTPAQWARHLQEELLDGAGYIEAMMAEGRELEFRGSFIANAQAAADWLAAAITAVRDTVMPAGEGDLIDAVRAVFDRAIAATGPVSVSYAEALGAIADNSLVHDAAWTARAALGQWHYADVPSAPDWFVAQAANAAPGQTDPEPEDVKFSGVGGQIETAVVYVSPEAAWLLCPADPDRGPHGWAGGVVKHCFRCGVRKAYVEPTS